MRVFSTFTGIGGFEIGMHDASVGRTKLEFVGYSEIDKYAIQVFEHHFKEVKNYGDITKIDAESLPDFECLVGGFPCQAFSIAGRRKGFDDTRGTLFFDLARILRAKQPRLFIFENVKGLLSHDGGRTFRTIIAAIDELGYDCQWQVLNSKNFGVPQNRERIVIVGHLRGQSRPQVFPLTGANSKDLITLNSARHDYDRIYGSEGIAPALNTGQRGNAQPKIITGTPKYVDGKRQVDYKLSDVAPTIRATQHKSGDNQPRVLVPEATKKGYAEATVGDSINLKQRNSKTRRGRVGKGIASSLEVRNEQYTVQPIISKTVRAGGRNSPHGSKQNWDSYLVDGAIRRLTPLECERLQGFPDNWTNVEGISDTQRYKMCGNAVTTNVIKAVFERVLQNETPNRSA